MLHFAICDDDPGETGQILAALERYRAVRPTLEWAAATYPFAPALLEALDGGARFDLYLLDIVMPDIDGIQVAEELRRRGAGGALIFFTSSPDYALEAFRVRALHYLLKPVADAVFFSALDEACALPRQPQERWLPIHTARGVVQVRYRDICYVECIRHVLCFHLADGAALNSRSIRVPFATAAAPLLEDGRFLHAHKSFILNMERVGSLTADSFRMSDGAILPVPRSKFAAVRRTYLDFLARQAGAQV